MRLEAVMRGRPSPLSSVALAAVLLVPVAIGGMALGTGSPYRAVSPSESVVHETPSHFLFPLPAPQGDGDVYADLIVAFQAGDVGAASARADRVLGPADGLSAGLGRGGCMVLAFDDLVIVNDGMHGNADLIVYETRTGAAEYAFLDVSADGVDYLRWGLLTGGTQAVDLSALDVSEVRFVRITDTGANHYADHAHSGFDLDAVRALSYVTYGDATEGLVHELTLGALSDTGVRQTCLD